MIAVLIYCTCILLIFFLSDVLHHKVKISADYTRKFVHVSSGVVTLTFPIYITEVWEITVMSMLFLGLLFVSEYKKWFKGITGVQRSTKGSWLFVITVWNCFMAYLKTDVMAFFIIPMTVLTFADALAFFVGKQLPIREYNILGAQKSIGGSAAFFVCTLLILFSFHYFFETMIPSYGFGFMLGVSILATATEAISSKGWDNITAPLLTLVCMYFQYSFNLFG